MALRIKVTVLKFNKPLLFLAAVIAGLGWWICQIHRPAVFTPEIRGGQAKISSAKSTQPNRQLMSDNVLKKTKLILPELSTAAKFQASEAYLPEELKLFISHGMPNVSVQTLQYLNGQHGFLIAYTSSGDIGVLRQQLVASLGQQMVAGRYNDAFTLLEGTKKNSNVKIILELQEDGNTAVSIQTVTLK